MLITLSGGSLLGGYLLSTARSLLLASIGYISRKVDNRRPKSNPTLNHVSTPTCMEPHTPVARDTRHVSALRIQQTNKSNNNFTTKSATITTTTPPSPPLPPQTHRNSRTTEDASTPDIVCTCSFSRLSEVSMYGPRPITAPATVTDPSTTTSDAAVRTPLTSSPALPTESEDRPLTPPPPEKSSAGDSRA